MLEKGYLVDGKYKILSEIGHGGMSVVYLAINESANKTWAIKEVRKDGTKDFEVVRQGLIVETDMLKRLNHPNLPSIIDVIDRDDNFLIVMDYIEGKALDKVLKENGPQPQEYVIEWAKELCDVLGYLHSRKPPIIYRDMKPANVMLKPDGHVTLIDFGTAREFKNAGKVEDTTCLGTQGYAAPEQFGGHGQTDPRTDVYCLGATLYHLVTGHNPAQPPYEMYPIRHWNPYLSEGLEEIIIKCTQKDPNNRFQSCSEVLYALDHYEEIGKKYKRSQVLRFTAFMTTFALSAGLLITSHVMKSKAAEYRNKNYDVYYSDAEKTDDEDEFKNLVESALDLDATDKDIYTLILNKYENEFGNETDSSSLTFEEMSAINGILTSKRMDEFKKADELAYYNFCYRYGRDIWLNIENSASNAKSWLNEVQEYNKGGENNRKDYSNAKLLSRLCEYGNTQRSSGNKFDADDTDYIAYWQDMNEIYSMASSSDSTFADNEGVRLYVFQKLLNIITLEDNCKKMSGSIELDAMDELVNNIENDINDESKFKLNQNNVQKTYATVQSLIKMARQKIAAERTSRGASGGAE